VLERLPAQGSMSLAQGGHALNEPFRDRPGREDPGVAGLAIRPMVWAAGLLMLAALALYLAPSQWWSRATPVAPVASPGAGAATTSSPLAVAKGAVTAAADAVASAPVTATGAAAAAPLASATPAVAGVTPSALPVGTPAFPPTASGGSSTATETVFLAPPPAAGSAAASASTTSPTTNTSTAAPGAKAGTEVLSVRTQRSAWLEVRDATGQVLLRNTVAPGEEIKLTGTPPLKVVIGNALATQLQFRGQPVDVVGRSQGNVARFDLP
jgi:cytoskeleton protein RodZ